MIKEKKSLYNLFYIFIFGSIFGWFVEGIWTLLKKGLIINHSALVIGPFNIIYGIGGVILTICLLNSKKSNIFIIFIKALIAGTILEYFSSIFMEYTLGFVAWNYSKKFMNFQGRICLFYSIFWGILGIVWIKLIYPAIDFIINKIPEKEGYKFIKIIIIFLMFDLALSMSAINRARNYEKNIPPENKYEEVLDKYFGVNYLNNMYNNRWNKK